MTKAMNDYAFRTRVDLPFEATVSEVTAALKEEGFGILTEIDVKATMKSKLDADFQKYLILGACNPQLAYQALKSELEIGLLLPCNVIIYEDSDEEGSIVSIIDPVSLLGMVINPSLEVVANEARIRLQSVIAALDD
jgi:uncharacterized protein (DUF302 family)